MTQHWAQRQSQSALWFFCTAAVVFLAGGTLATFLIHVGPHKTASEHATFPFAFAISTALLAGGSLSLQRACQSVRVERQSRFRQSLIIATLAGTLFVGVQSYG